MAFANRMTTLPHMTTDDAGRAERVAALKKSTSYRQAHLDPDFMARVEMRPVRLQLELLKPELTLQEHGINSTIVVFGGTRILERAEAEERVEQAKEMLARQPADEALQREVRVAESILRKAHYYDEAREFG